MGQLDMKTGADATAPNAPLSTSGSMAIYSLPVEYRKSIRFRVNGKIISLKGGRALTLERLIAAGPVGIDRATTMQWIANVADTIKALKKVGVKIDTRKGHPTNYVLTGPAEKIGDIA